LQVRQVLDASSDSKGKTRINVEGRKGTEAQRNKKWKIEKLKQEKL
jgi:hypothetical protein